MSHVKLNSRRRFKWWCSPDDTMTQLHEEQDDQRQPTRQHPANHLRYPVGIASVNDERDGERHLAVSSHSLSIPVTGSLPLPPPPFYNHSRREEHPSTFFARFLPARHYLWSYICIYIYTAFMRTPTGTWLPVVTVSASTISFFIFLGGRTNSAINKEENQEG